MLIINADDFGRSRPETEAALKCFTHGRISSVTTMVFMEDSERGAELARTNKLEAGLHVNFDEPFSAPDTPTELRSCHEKTTRYLNRHKLSQLIYNPFRANAFEYSCKKQLEEFERLFGAPPSHIDGHHHMHLCANLVLSNVIPQGTRMRRTFSFSPGEKSWLNRTYRTLLDSWLRRKYDLPDYFFDLSECTLGAKLERVVALAAHASVELMTHPIIPSEMDYLMSPEFEAVLRAVDLRSYSDITVATGAILNAGKAPRAATNTAQCPLL